ncbi:MAG: YeeE/YedE thiosulfate transporter family protein [Armatimonadota bacterium]|nr:YeeE/YedE thiosulfate transporter family protein [Armatimonadota bacterium]
MTLPEKLRDDYRVLFGEPWPPWVGGLLIGILNVFLFLFYQPWTTLDGALNWGDWVLSRLGLVRTEALSPLLRSGSVLNLGLLFGATASALLAREFGVRVGPGRELAKGFLGGVLLGLGAALARGCNIGGFFSATSALAASGLAMAVGLAAGAFLGARYLVWEVARLPASPAVVAGGSGLVGGRRSPQTGLGVALLFGLLAWAVSYRWLGYSDRGLLLMFGVLLGMICQRSRVCFVQAFREPFLTGDTRHLRALLLGLLVSVVGFALVKAAILDKAEEFVRPTFWLGSFAGGVVFGVGMVLAGGCGAGSIWRAGEGHVKLWLALVGYVFSASLVRDWLVRSQLQEHLGTAVFLPEVVGWAGSLLLVLGVLLAWYLVASWNEVSRKLTAL